MRRGAARAGGAYPTCWRRPLGGVLAAAPGLLTHAHSLPHPLVCSCRELPAAVKPALLTAASNLLLALPSHAEAGKIFGEPPAAAQRAMAAACCSAALRQPAAARALPPRPADPRFTPPRTPQTSTRPCRS